MCVCVCVCVCCVCVLCVCNCIRVCARACGVHQYMCLFVCMLVCVLACTLREKTNEYAGLVRLLVIAFNRVVFWTVHSCAVSTVALLPHSAFIRAFFYVSTRTLAPLTRWAPTTAFLSSVLASKASLRTTGHCAQSGCPQTRTCLYHGVDLHLRV